MKVIGRIRLDAGEYWYFGPSGIRQRARIKNCPGCLEDFATTPSSKTIYCSLDCRKVECARCSSPFTPASNRSVYCSEKCKRGSGICRQCGREYVYSKHGANKFCSPTCFYDSSTPVGTSFCDTSNGYRLIKVEADTPGSKKVGRSGWMLHHRFVMQQMLGRPLLNTERVHHKNGNRGDNRPENLELWKGAHPQGVRAKDYHCAGCRCGIAPVIRCD